MSTLKDKVIFITGSSQGIGKTLAIELAKRGAIPVLNGRKEVTLKAAAREVAEAAKATLKAAAREVAEAAQATQKAATPLYIVADVTHSDQFQKALDTIIETHGRLDGVVLNAGLASSGKMEHTSDETLDNVLRINIQGPFIGARTALPYLKKTKGSVVFISSIAGLHGVPNASVYSMSKMALTALAQSMKTELNGSGVHVGIIYVGFTKNDPNKQTIGPDGTLVPIQERPAWIQQSTEKVARKIIQSIRQRRFRMVLSPMGWTSAFGSRYFPRLWQLSMRGVLKQAEKLTN